MVSLIEKTAVLRRQHILDAAIEVFSERGFDRASIREIATAASVADGTIYNVFENKEALLMALLDALKDAPTEPAVAPELLHTDPSKFLLQLLEQRIKTYTPRTMAILRVTFSQALVDAEFRKKFFDVFLAPALEGMTPLLGTVFESGESQEHAPSATPRLVVASFMGLIMMALLEDNKDAPPLHAMTEPLAKMLWSGLGKREGLNNDV
jgi:AcrR family transcriptional regulator